MVDLESYRKETPSIDEALKTYLSLRMAKEKVTPGETANGAGPPANARSPLGLLAGSAGNVGTALYGCARVFLRTLNSPLPPEEQVLIGATSGGSSASTGGACAAATESERRSDKDLSAYRALQEEWERLLTAGEKPAKKLGRSALCAVLPAISAQLIGSEEALAASAASAKATKEDLQQFLEGFASLALAADDAAASEDAQLVWAPKWKAEIDARREARREEAEKRAERATTNEALSAELRAALRPKQSVIIEEVDEDGGGEE